MFLAYTGEKAPDSAVTPVALVTEHVMADQEADKTDLLIACLQSSHDLDGEFLPHQVMVVEGVAILSFFHHLTLANIMEKGGKAYLQTV
jgi:hypothetical protein